MAVQTDGVDDGYEIIQGPPQNLTPESANDLDNNSRRPASGRKLRSSAYKEKPPTGTSKGIRKVSSSGDGWEWDDEMKAFRTWDKNLRTWIYWDEENKIEKYWDGKKWRFVA